MIRGRVQDQFWLNPLGGYIDNPHSEMVVPATVRRRTRVEQDQVSRPVDEWLMAMAEENAIHFASERLARNLTRGPASVTVNDTEPMRPDHEFGRPRQDRRQLVVIVVPVHGNQRCNVCQIFEDRPGRDIAEVDYQIDPGALEEIDHGVGNLPARSRVDVGIRDHADPGGRIELPPRRGWTGRILLPIHRSLRR